MNLYHYLYYLIYKFLDFNASEETRVHVPSISRVLFLIGIANYYLALILTIKLFQYISYNLFLFIVIFILPIVTLYFLNENYFLSEIKYNKISNCFDKKNKLKKMHFTIISILYLFGSIVMLILAGINYTNSN